MKQQNDACFEQQLARLMPLPELPASLSAQAVAARLAAGEAPVRQSGKSAVHIWKRAALAAAAVLLLAGLGAAGGVLRAFLPKGAAPEAASEDSAPDLQQEYELQNETASKQGNGVQEDSGTLQGVCGGKATAGEPLPLEVAAGQTVSCELDASFSGDAAVAVLDPASGAPLAGVCSAQLGQPQERGSVLLAEGLAPGQALVRIEENGTLAEVLVTVTEAAQ